MVSVMNLRKTKQEIAQARENILKRVAYHRLVSRLSVMSNMNLKKKSRKLRKHKKNLLTRVEGCKALKMS